MTECAPIVALNRECDYKDDAAGLQLPGLAVCIDHPGAEGVGEIVVKGPSVMVGYYEQPEETARVFATDGHFRTGDLGYIDADGFLHITGRAKNVIIAKNGRNVYPEELESLINRNPYVQECMVYSKPDPKDRDDVIVAAQIVPAMEFINEAHGGADSRSDRGTDPQGGARDQPAAAGLQAHQRHPHPRDGVH